jgi:hypothetical protein
MSAVNDLIEHGKESDHLDFKEISYKKANHDALECRL